MALHKWADIAAERSTPKQREESKAAARRELERMGYSKLRKARKLTQAEIAEKLGVSQPSVAALESRTDIMLSTLARYIEALGGRLEVSAVFPNGSFNLAPPASAFHEGFAETEEKKIGMKPIQQAKSPKRTRRTAAA